MSDQQLEMNFGVADKPYVNSALRTSTMPFAPERGMKHSNMRCFGLKAELEEEAVAKHPS